MKKGVLQQTIKNLLLPGRGILAADESIETIGKRFEKTGISNTEDNREAYREFLFTTPGISQYVSGVILFEETLRESTRDGIPLHAILEEHGIVVGIKVDKGLKSLYCSPQESVTQGIEDLGDRLDEYFKLGARFAKWRAVFRVDNDLPTDSCIEKNAQLFATYAKLCHQFGIVPIVEPEVLSNGKHSQEMCFVVTQKVLKNVFEELKNQKVDLSKILLKPNMIVPGLESDEKMGPKNVAKLTVQCLLSTVPKEVPGIVFLSGGQSEREACQNLNEIAKHKDVPWAITYSFGRALQNSGLEAWARSYGQIPLAQEAFLNRAKLVSLAQKGKYNVKLEKKLSN